MIRSFWWRMVPPFECTVVKDECKEFLLGNSDLGRRIIESELFGHIRSKPDSIVRSVRIDHEPATKVALSLIATIAKMKLSSGNHHTYRGVLSMTGSDIQRTWSAALKRMVDAGYIEPDFAADMDAELKARIGSVG